MILVDTSVWVDHLRNPEDGLNLLLAANDVIMHPMVIGELACGYLPNRNQALVNLRILPMINELSHEDVILMIQDMRLMGLGIGFVDMHLLCSVIRNQDSLLWTKDNSLQRIANELNIAFENNH